jgi:hypothetical protein
MPTSAFANGGNGLLMLEVNVEVDCKPCWVIARGEPAGSYTRRFEGKRLLTDYELHALRESRGQSLHDLEPPARRAPT